MGTYVGCSNSESYQNVPNVFACQRGEVRFSGNGALKHHIDGKSGTIADVLMPVLTMAINEPFF